MMDLRPEGGLLSQNAPRPGRLLAWTAESALVLALVGLILACFWIRWLTDQPLSQAEHAKHLINAVLLYWSQAGAGCTLEWWRTLLLWPSQYPALPFLWTGVAFRLLGVSESSAFVSSLSWLFILLVTVYLFVRKHAGRTVASLATILTGTSSVMVGTVLFYTPDVALTALAFVGLSLLADDPTLSRPGRALAFGCVLGASLLARYLAVWYFFLPVAATAATGLWRASWSDRLRFLLFLALLALFSAVFVTMVDRYPLAVQCDALAVAAIMWFLSRRKLGAGGDNRLGNLLGSIVVAWALAIAAYVHIVPILWPLLGPDTMAPPGTTWWDNRHQYQDMATHLLFGSPVLLLVGLSLTIRVRYLRIIALSFFSAGILVVTSSHPPLACYAGPLVPLAVVLGTGWLRSVPSLVRVPIVAVLFAVGLAQCACVTGLYGGLGAGYFRSFQEVELLSTGFVGDRAAQAHMEALSAGLVRRLPMPAKVIVAVETGDPRLVAFDTNGVQLQSILKRYPLVWQRLFLSDEGLLPIEPCVGVEAWALGQAGGPVLSPSGAGDQGIPLRAVLLIAHPKDYSSRVSLLEKHLGQELRTVRSRSMPFGVRAWVLFTRQADVEAASPGLPHVPSPLRASPNDPNY